MFRAFNEKRENVPELLLGGEAQGLAGLVDHLAHLTDAAGALDLAPVGAKHVSWTVGARLNGGADLTFTNAVAVADVQGQSIPT